VVAWGFDKEDKKREKDWKNKKAYLEDVSTSLFLFFLALNEFYFSFVFLINWMIPEIFDYKLELMIITIHILYINILPYYY
jgi:hypothetical protein